MGCGPTGPGEAIRRSARRLDSATRIGTVSGVASGGTPHCEVDEGPSKYGVTTDSKKKQRADDFITEIAV